MGKKPVIGITLDWAEQGSFSKSPHYALRQDYFDIVEKAGGVPLGIPYNKTTRQACLEMVDGLIIPGGTIAKPLEWYEEGTAELPYQPSPRLESDIWFVQKFIEMKKPFLGICEGMQVLAGVMGCTLTANVHSCFQTKINHAQGQKASQRVHDIEIIAGTQLHQILCGEICMTTNSAHREGVKELSANTRMSAKSADGVVEAFEVINHPFAFGVEWHPEFFLEQESPDMKILRAFVGAAKNESEKVLEP